MSHTASPQSLALPNPAVCDRQSSDGVRNVPVLPGESIVFGSISSNSVMPYPTLSACMVKDVASKAESSMNLEGNIDGQSLHSKEKPPRSLLDKILLLTICLGVICYATYQIIQCVAAYAEPISSSVLENVTRVFPGVMICPYSHNFDSAPFGCNSPDDPTPLWAPDGSLSIDWWGNQPECLLHSNSYGTTDEAAFLASLEEASTSKRSACPNFVDPDTIAKVAGRRGGSPAVIFGIINKAAFAANASCAFISFARTVIVKNSAKSLKCTAAGCATGPDSFTPPKVQCLVYDPSFFDDEAKKFGMDPKCNPMREVSANSLDSFLFRAPLGVTSSDPDLGKGYEFRGLRCLNRASQLKLTLHDVQRHIDSGRAGMANNLSNLYLFGNAVAVVYDSARGVPNDLNFDDITAWTSEGVASSEKEGHILGFTILTYLDLEHTDPYNPKQHTAPPIRVQSSLRMDTRFTNVVLERTTTTSTLSATFSPATTSPYRIPGIALLMSFSTPHTVVSKPAVSLSILTAIGAIFGVASGLLESQEYIKVIARLVAAKAMHFYRGKCGQ